MDEPIEFVVEPKKRTGEGVSTSVVVSLVIHSLLIIGLIRAYHPVRSDDKPAPIARYVELIRQNPREFTEAPGPARDRAPLNAPWSDLNRRASAAQRTGDTPTTRPGDDHSLYTPPIPSGNPAARAQETAPQSSQQQAAQQRTGQTPLPADITSGSSRIPAFRTAQASVTGNPVNWNSVIKDVTKVASLGGDQGLDLRKIGNEGGGEKGFAEQGPLSFETQWYDWGAYAQSMVSRIRINWYDNMPPLIRTGMKGVATIRFTIQRDGRITDVTLLTSSTVPPYDFAAKKAIELSSPLNPLPADFPKSSEHVTAMFFYNSEPPSR